tara:strand:- start:506 stop:697 length:192 start_codon:yes stop_codon:yes gene_type:complete
MDNEKKQIKKLIKHKLDQEKLKHSQKIKKHKKRNVLSYGHYGKVKPIVDQVKRNVSRAINNYD